MRPAKDLKLKQEYGKKIWVNCMKLAILQIKLGGDVYVEQPYRCGTWRLNDKKTEEPNDLMNERPNAPTTELPMDRITKPPNNRMTE